VLKQLHYAHQGVEKCRLRAKSSVFWDGINRDIEKKIGACAQCQTHQPSASHEPLLPHDVPPRPWHTVSSDLFYWEQNHYLLVADMFSKFPIVRKMHTISSRSVINHLRGIFDEHGIPERFVSDNGPQYISDEFKQFAANYGFEHVTSSPMYPRSNGFSERMVQTVKHLFTKARESGQDPHLAMLCLRTTPIDHHTPSPCEILNGRRYRSNLPIVGTKETSVADHTDSLQRRQDLYKRHHDRGAKYMPPLQPRERVRVQDPVSKLWVPGQVTQVLSEPRSYRVQTSSGMYRRNRHHLRQTAEMFSPPGRNENLSEVTDPSQTTRPPDNEDNLRSTTVPTPTAEPVTDTTRTVDTRLTVPPLRRSARASRPPDKLDL